MRFEVGTVVRITGRFLDNRNKPRTPGSIVFKFSSLPTIPLTTYTWPTDPELKRERFGSYYVDLTLSVDGDWIARWEGTNPVAATAETRIEVYE